MSKEFKEISKNGESMSGLGGSQNGAMVWDSFPPPPLPQHLAYLRLPSLGLADVRCGCWKPTISTRYRTASGQGSNYREKINQPLLAGLRIRKDSNKSAHVKNCAGILKQSMGARNRLGKGL